VFSREVEIIHFMEDQVVFECDFWFHIQKMLIEELGGKEVKELISLFIGLVKMMNGKYYIPHRNYDILKKELRNIKNSSKIWEYLSHHKVVFDDTHPIEINYQKLNCIQTWMEA
jgi:hypothetical protein